MLREQVLNCRKLQLRRQGCINAHLSQTEMQRYCRLDERNVALLEDAVRHFNLSTRACFRIAKMARSIADLAEESGIASMHLMEAISYRKFESA